MQQFLDRYLAGDHALVWDELRRLPVERVMLMPEVEAVCRETMRRVRVNLDTIVSRLRASGYSFHDVYGKDIAPLTGPEFDSGSLAQLIETTFGPLPFSVRSFMTVVGDVCFLGNHAQWGIDYPPKGFSTFVYVPNLSITPAESPVEIQIWYPDPLVLEFRLTRYRLSLDEVIRGYRDSNDSTFEGPDRLEFAADEVHKAGYSGGTPYYVHLPDGGADGRVSLDRKGDMYFVDYLRHAILDWGGFPGFDAAPVGRDSGLIAELKRGLIPF